MYDCMNTRYKVSDPSVWIVLNFRKRCNTNISLSSYLIYCFLKYTKRSQQIDFGKPGYEHDVSWISTLTQEAC